MRLDGSSGKSGWSRFLLAGLFSLWSIMCVSCGKSSPDPSPNIAMNLTQTRSAGGFRIADEEFFPYRRGTESGWIWHNDLDAGGRCCSRWDLDGPGNFYSEDGQPLLTFHAHSLDLVDDMHGEPCLRHPHFDHGLAFVALQDGFVYGVLTNGRPLPLHRRHGPFEGHSASVPGNYTAFRGDWVIVDLVDGKTGILGVDHEFAFGPTSDCKAVASRWLDGIESLTLKNPSDPDLRPFFDHGGTNCSFVKSATDPRWISDLPFVDRYQNMTGYRDAGSFPVLAEGTIVEKRMAIRFKNVGTGFLSVQSMVSNGIPIRIPCHVQFEDANGERVARSFDGPVEPFEICLFLHLGPSPAAESFSFSVPVPDEVNDLVSATVSFPVLFMETFSRHGNYEHFSRFGDHVVLSTNALFKFAFSKELQKEKQWGRACLLSF